MSQPTTTGEQQAAYKNPALSFRERASDLLERMSLEEKLDQLGSYMDPLAWSESTRKRTAERIAQVLSIPASEAVGGGVGQISCLLRELPPGLAAKKANEIQLYAKENTRLGIPPIIHDEGLHGLLGNGATSFPQAIGMASSWNPDLLSQVARAIAREARSRGLRQMLSPTINLARDPRCGRTEETYGEDPYLAARMALAFVLGLQEEGVIATPKHFAANFAGDGGRDSAAIHSSENLLREDYLLAFEACVREGKTLSIMAAYNSLNGIPCSCHRWLLSELLREEWGFKGFVVSDYTSVSWIMEKHAVASDLEEAAQKALDAGLDVELPRTECFGGPLLEAVRKGRVAQETVDSAVRRVLEVKLRTGLFDDPFVDPETAAAANHTPEHQELALQMARQAIVLLKNDGNLLPFSPDLRSIAAIGPLADIRSLGGYSWEGYHPGELITPLDGLRSRVPQGVQVQYSRGCDVMGKDYGLTGAIELARRSDVAVIFAGNTNQTEGEWRDRANLDLPGLQTELILAVAETGTPTIVVLINGSAITMSDWIDRVPVVVEAWYPGEKGGYAISDVLLGRYNPAGRLPISIPQAVGQLPLYYNLRPTGRRLEYFDVSGKPLFPFGHGLSYTTFSYQNLHIQPLKVEKGGVFEISLEVENTGGRDGDEVVQVYVHDRVASMVRPVKELKSFKRLCLAAGEKKRVSFALEAAQMGFYNAAMQYVVEPGEFEILVGASSEDIRLAARVFVT